MEERKAVADRYVKLAREFGDRGRLWKVIEDAERFEGCGKEFAVWRCPECIHQYRTSLSCNARVCSVCARRTRRIVQDRLEKVIHPYAATVGKAYSLKFLTLTWTRGRWGDGYPSQSALKRCKREAGDMIRRFYSKFAPRVSRNGRTYASKKRRNCGAFVVWELGKTNNLHCHAVVFGPYIPNAKLSQAWLDITRDSKVVDIRAVHQPSRTVRYVAKSPVDSARFLTSYIAKSPVNLSPAHVAAWWWLMKGSRVLQTYGVFYNTCSAAREKRTDKPEFCCLFCDEHLLYRGIGADVRGRLIDWWDVHRMLTDPGTVGGPRLRSFQQPGQLWPDQRYDFDDAKLPARQAA